MGWTAPDTGPSKAKGGNVGDKGTKQTGPRMWQRGRISKEWRLAETNPPGRGAVEAGRTAGVAGNLRGRFRHACAAFLLFFIARLHRPGGCSGGRAAGPEKGALPFVRN